MITVEWIVSLPMISFVIFVCKEMEMIFSQRFVILILIEAAFHLTLSVYISLKLLQLKTPFCHRSLYKIEEIEV